MSAFLFTGWISRYCSGHFSDHCLSLLSCGESEDEARTRFDEWLLGQHEHEDRVPTKIEKIIVSPVLGHLFTEAGPVAVDWRQIAEEADAAMQAMEADVWEQGYWIDCNQLLHPDSLSADIDSLRSETQDVCSDLNWAADKKFFFLVSVLKPPTIEEYNPSELDVFDDADGDYPDESGEELKPRKAPFPELAEREITVLVHARNSLVAAWLWRKHAANTPIAKNAIRIDPWCGAVVA